MKITLLVISSWLLLGCQSMFNTEYAKAQDKIPEVKQFVIQDLELTDPATVSFIKNTTPEFRTIHGITYYWWKDTSGRAIFTAEANSDTLELLNAVKN